MPVKQAGRRKREGGWREREREREREAKGEKEREGEGGRERGQGAGDGEAKREHWLLYIEGAATTSDIEMTNPF